MWKYQWAQCLLLSGFWSYLHIISLKPTLIYLNFLEVRADLITTVCLYFSDLRCILLWTLAKVPWHASGSWVAGIVRAQASDWPGGSVTLEGQHWLQLSSWIRSLEALLWRWKSVYFGGRQTLKSKFLCKSVKFLNISYFNNFKTLVNQNTHTHTHTTCFHTDFSPQMSTLQLGFYSI